MRIGVPKEIKVHEYRIGLSPASVRELVRHGHAVMVESGAGLGIGADDALYERMGAQIRETADEIFAEADMIVKVKEPQPEECRKLRPGQVLFTYLHLAPDPQQAALLRESGCVAIAYETVTDDQNGLPLLAPMSEIAGRMSIQAGAHALEKEAGGRGVLLGGVPGVAPGRVLIIGGGVSGTNAARMAVGLGADVTILERSIERMRELDDIFQGRVKLVHSTHDALESLLAEADLVVCAVLVPGAAAPKLIDRRMLREMLTGSVVVDISIDQGGCLETSRPTTHADPIYEEEGVIHYCVANMPGAVARTSTLALNNATLPFALALADKGWKEALKADPHLREGLNVCDGQITHPAVAEALGTDYVPASQMLN